MKIEMLKKLCETNAVATQEDKIKNLLVDWIKEDVDQVYEDKFGNLIARKQGQGPKFLLAAHTDQIGFMIHAIEENGCLRFAAVGGLIPFTLIGQRVVINDTIHGVINVDIDLEAGGDMGKAGVNRMFIDIGTCSKAESLEKVSIGDFGNFYSEFYENETRIMARALDDRIGCFILLEVIRQMKDTPYDLYFVFTSQEETGTRGAVTAAYTIEPEYGIAVDITPAGDLLGTKNSTAKMDGGVGIKLMDPSLIIHPELKKMLTDKANQHGIPFQYEMMKRGGTDAGAFQSVHTGVKSAAISVPTRHAHTANEMVSKQDVQAAIDLILAVIQ